MKLANVKNDSRAACYLAKRRQSPGAWPATQAWAAANNHAENIKARQITVDDSKRILSEMWEKLGHKEPKKYSPEGMALSEARATLTAQTANLSHLRAYVPRDLSSPAPGGHYSDSWYYLGADNGVGVFRNVQSAHDVLNLGHSGWFTDDQGGFVLDGAGLCWGVVAQLPGRNGAAQYLAGYQFGGMDSGVSISLATVYADPEAAARAGDSYAEKMAEKEKDFQEAYRAGCDFAEQAEFVKVTRRACLQLMTESKAAPAVSPGIRNAVRAAICAHIKSIAKARATMADLAGQYRDAAQEVAFWESANIESMPA